MTYTISKFSTLNMEGVDVTATYIPYSSTTGVPEYPAVPFLVGTQTNAINGARYIFVLAGAAITANQAVSILPTTFSTVPLTKTLTDNGYIVAVAPTAIASGSYGWVQISGSASVTLKNGCLPNTPLYTSASAGMLMSTSASQTRIYGIRATATAGSSGAAVTCYISNLTV